MTRSQHLGLHTETQTTYHSTFLSISDATHNDFAKSRERRTREIYLSARALMCYFARRETALPQHPAGAGDTVAVNRRQ